MSNTDTTTAIVTTAIGNIAFAVLSGSGEIPCAKISTKIIVSSLPSGMRVERVSAVLLTFKAQMKIHGLKFICSWSDLLDEGSSCSGEGLAAWEWEKNKRLVVIGTEEGDVLSERLGLGEITFENNPVKKYSNEIAIELDELEQAQSISLHFIIAENPYPEKQDSSCWFAVDIPHHQVLNEFI